MQSGAWPVDHFGGLVDIQTIAPRLEGRVALVTGGSRGIGRAVAERFCAEGAILAVNYSGNAKAAAEVVDRLAEIDRMAGRPERPHVAVQADVADARSVQRMFDEVLGRFGRLDILVNNAGIQEETPGDSFDDATMAQILAVNLTGVAVCCRTAIAHFLSRPGGGAIVNNSSVHQVIPKPDYLAYAMSKAGLGHLTRTLALEFAGRGIRVNAVGPGAVATDMNAAWTGEATARAAVERHIPLGYAAEAEAIAPAFAFLASDEASYITGQTLFVCGGLTLYADFKENWSS
jgi:glucose 1-dehydrogenase